MSSISDRDGNASIFSKLQEGRRQFLALVENVRPELHRYCARMTGSIAEGEDIVQDTLAHAYYELAELKELPAMRSWLFRIAHNRALDYLRRYDRRMVEPLDDAFDIVNDDALNPEDALAHDQAVRAAVSRFLELVPAQRSCVILKDVLDYSLDEIAALLDLSVPAVKAVLHRGRERLRELCETPTPATPGAARRCSRSRATPRCSTRATGTACVRCSPKTSGSISYRESNARAASRSATTSPTMPRSAIGIWSRRYWTRARSLPCSAIRTTDSPATSSSSD